MSVSFELRGKKLVKCPRKLEYGCTCKSNMKISFKHAPPPSIKCAAKQKERKNKLFNIQSKY